MTVPRLARNDARSAHDMGSGFHPGSSLLFLITTSRPAYRAILTSTLYLARVSSRPAPRPTLGTSLSTGGFLQLEKGAGGPSVRSVEGSLTCPEIGCAHIRDALCILMRPAAQARPRLIGRTSRGRGRQDARREPPRTPEAPGQAGRMCLCPPAPAFGVHSCSQLARGGKSRSASQGRGLSGGLAHDAECNAGPKDPVEQDPEERALRSAFLVGKQLQAGRSNITSGDEGACHI
ncbi:hypothetical protein DAEQUDRAFT_241612 [Daedalea quercina L-15889]|uniref:Uncharacterized protein n=1 Tax=Daedalea quercina L-15889 TaxID=1314783 RepID=A0A165QR91_9APHY|nr:hypothetical protein DAEQUDRAFT_241612 [Daedalea quercina L-15889]